MRYLKVGIAYEGGNDGELLATIVRRVLEPHGFTFKDFNPETPGTAIIDYVQTYTRRFVEAAVDIGIYCTDQDKDSLSRRRAIEGKIKNEDEAFILKAVIGVPVPHIEAWLVQQDSVVKNLLGINGSDALPHPELSPKDRLTALYSGADTYFKSPNELRIEIAQNLNIEICCRQNTEFRQFIQDVRSILTRLQRP